MSTSSNSRYFLTLIAFLIGLNCFGQSDWMNWDEVSLNLGLSKKMDVEASHLRAYNINQSFKNSYNQWGANMDYDFTKKLSARIGYKLTNFPSGRASGNRFLVRGNYKIRLAKVVSWSNAFQGEVNTAAGKGNYYRVIYMTRVAPRKRLNFLRLSPSVSYWLYYNIGGNAIQYFDEAGSPLVMETPDGIHRGRFKLSLNSKVSNNLSLSLYYMNQHEFNFIGNDINVVDPNTGKIERPFNNFQVAGLDLVISFDIYKRKGQKKNEND